MEARTATIPSPGQDNFQPLAGLSGSRVIQGQQGLSVVPEVGLDQSFTIGAAREQAGPPSQVRQTPPEVSP